MDDPTAYADCDTLEDVILQWAEAHPKLAREHTADTLEHYNVSQERQFEVGISSLDAGIVCNTKRPLDGGRVKSSLGSTSFWQLPTIVTSTQAN